MEKSSLGSQELEVLRFIADHAPVTAREVVAEFAKEQQLARTTILTVIERLRKKGFLDRRRRDGVYRYSPRTPKAEVLQTLVRQFIEKTLAGSVSPFVIYLTRTRQVSDDDLAELESLVAELKQERERTAPCMPSALP